MTKPIYIFYYSINIYNDKQKEDFLARSLRIIFFIDFSTTTKRKRMTLSRNLILNFCD